MIHVCFALNDATGLYSKFTGAAICSIFDNTDSKVTIHILHDNSLTLDKRNKFIKIAESYNQLIVFYDIEKSYSDKFNALEEILPDFFKTTFSVAAIYRLLIPQILPKNIDNIIYLDSDIIVNLDINELWQIPLDDRPLGAIPQILNEVPSDKLFDVCIDGTIKNEDYFNSGVLLMNLIVLRNEKDMLVSIEEFVHKYPEDSFFDQDFLNYCFAKRTLKLPLKFNRFVRIAREKKESVNQRTIYHYCGKRFGFNLNDPFNKLWFDYFIRIPWFDFYAIYNLFKFINELFTEFGQVKKNLLIDFSAAMSGKTRVFVIDAKTNIKWLKKEYSIRDDEEIFVCDEYDLYDSLQLLINEMKISCDKKVFFVRIKEFIEPLKEAGFVENKNFFNHMVFFSPILLNQKNAYSLLKAM